MRRHKAVARIFLFLSIVNFTFASLAQTPIPTMHEARIDLVTGAEGMAEVSEMAHTQSEELPELLGRPSTAGHLQSRLDIAPAPSFSDASLAADAEKNKFFNKELNRRMKEYLVLGTIAGLFTGLANGMQKEIMGSVSPNAQTVGRAVEDLNRRSEDQKDLVSRSLSSMRDEDLQMMSVISRRMLNNLDQESGSREG